MLRLQVNYLSFTHSNAFDPILRPDWFLPNQYQFSLFLGKKQFSLCMWSNSSHQNRLLLTVQFQFQLAVELFCRNLLFSCIANVHYHFGRTKGEFSTPALAADRFCLLRLYELRRGSLADISHGGCDRLEPSGKVRSCPLPGSQAAPTLLLT